MSAKKFDQGKPDLSLIPYVAEEAEAFAFMDGTKKYGRYNYLLGLTASQLVSAARRHLGLWFSGETYAKDSGVHHLGHARACLAMILHLEETGALIDDRPFTENEEEKVLISVEHDVKYEDLGSGVLGIQFFSTGD